MISFYSENDFNLEHEEEVKNWISSIILNEDYLEGEITFVFCSDDYLLKINEEFLNHNTYTDIISFDYSLDKELHGEIYISTERIVENASEYKTAFIDELHRVIIHGILHLCGYKDKNEREKEIMRKKENQSLLSRKFI
jgi:rRNA maturation RNase YbeY